MSLSYLLNLLPLGQPAWIARRNGGTDPAELDVLAPDLLGSSIYNILIILSIPCMIAPGGLAVERELLWFDIPLMAGVAIGAIPVFLTGKRVSRLEGGLELPST